jgi:hypothetical protein
MEDTTKEKEKKDGMKKEKKNDHDTLSILDTRRTDEVDLPVIPASESTEVSDAVDMFITDLNCL